MREIEKEGPVSIVGDELHRLLCVPFCQGSMVDRPLDNLIVLHQRDVPILRLRSVEGGCPVPVVAWHGHSHIVRVRKSEPRVEALMDWQELWELAQVPLAHHASPVAD